MVIPAFNNYQLTDRCVTRLLTSTDAAILADVIVVDDASTDGVSATWTAAQTRFKPVLVPKNLGFAGACNAGAAAASGEALLFLNTDAFAHPGSVRALQDCLARDGGIGIAGARLLYADGSIQHAGMGLLRDSSTNWWHVAKHHPDNFPDALVARDVLAVTGAALLIRRPLFDALTGFDEQFFNGWEDVDLCLRAWCSGARVRYEPRAVFDHLEGATLDERASQAQNELRFAARWDPVLAAAPRYPLPEVPPIALAVNGASKVGSGDDWALAHIRRMWGAHFGASVTQVRAGSRFDRARVDLRAALDRRLPTLEVAWGDAARTSPTTGGRRAALAAPQTSDNAGWLAQSTHVRAWWTPTQHARELLLAAGVPAQAIRVVRLGARRVPTTLRPNVGSALVIGSPGDAKLLEEVQRRCPGTRTITIALTCEPDVGGADMVLVTPGADRWGLLAATALAHGCAIVTTPPCDPIIAASPGVVVAPPDDLLETLLRAVLGVQELRAKAVDIALDARRRLDGVLAAQHAAELARALCGGLPSSSHIEVDAGLAAHLRAARAVSDEPHR